MWGNMRWLLLAALLGCEESPPESNKPDNPIPPPSHSVSRECAPVQRASAQLETEAEPWLVGSGVAIADIDGDGTSEIFAGGPTGTWWRWDGELKAMDNPLPTAPTHVIGGTFADWDSDGDQDLIVLRDQAAVVLYENHDGRFAQVAIDPAAQAPVVNMGAVFGDLDDDGDLDLLLVRYGIVDLSGTLPRDYEPGHRTMILENVEGAFIARPSWLTPEQAYGYTYAAVIQDLNHDGLQDIYLANDFGSYQKNQHLVRTLSGFRMDEDSGLSRTTTSMGLAFHDPDGDGDDEIFIPAFHDLLLLVPRDGQWFDRTEYFGLELGERQNMGWGATFIDLDADGVDELVAGFGYMELGDRWEIDVQQPDAVYHFEDDLWTDRGAQWGLDDLAQTRGVVAADLDNDGAPELVRMGTDGLLRVDAFPCTGVTRLTVRAEDLTRDNRHGVGARVYVHAGGKVQSKVLRAGGEAFASSAPTAVHFVLPSSDSVDVEVVWSGGGRTWVRGVDSPSLLVQR